MKKVVFRSSVLIFLVAFHFMLGKFFAAPDWFGYAEHFFIGGMMTAWTVVAFLEWWRGRVYFESVIGLCAFLGILWEVFEYWGFQGHTNNTGYYADTIWDFQMNFFGALIIALTYTLKNIEYKRINILKRKMGAK